MSQSIVIELSRELPGSPAVVWHLLTDWERQGEWMLEASDFRVLGDRREGVGVEAEATIRIAGIRTRDRIRVTAWEPPEHLRIEHLGWVKGSGDMRLSATPNGTRLDWREEFVPPLGPLGAAGMRLMKPLITGIFRRDLAVLEGLVRAQAGR